jgi:hypothetical protein
MPTFALLSVQPTYVGRMLSKYCMYLLLCVNGLNNKSIKIHILLGVATKSLTFIL